MIRFELDSKKVDVFVTALRTNYTRNHETISQISATLCRILERFVMCDEKYLEIHDDVVNQIITVKEMFVPDGTLVYLPYSFLSLLQED